MNGNSLAINPVGIKTTKNIFVVEEEKISCLSMKETEDLLKKHYKTDCTVCLAGEFHEGYARVIFIKENKAKYGFISEKTKKLAFNEQLFISAEPFKKDEKSGIIKAATIFENGDEGFINNYGKPTVLKQKKKKRIFFTK